ncbi:MAG: zinc-ribbon domain-containing protein [Candidatus Andeanibacterium colombiense]|uniref:Zinc-ribbon domain-containing protein n=1 Tax=Candidatus Andeanibacterium colombiense TaxID=3121345 RepID=A0AAJ6BR89_9SPHN|nr:MAG: zinc-ribbon domain-containing protein [Sphingomonadaceae bacterium]
MIIACPACATRYVVPDSAIGVEGRTVRCAKCRHSWFQDGPELALPPGAPAAAPEPRIPQPVRAPAPPPPTPAPVPARPIPAAPTDPEPDARPGFSFAEDVPSAPPKPDRSYIREPDPAPPAADPVPFAPPPPVPDEYDGVIEDDYSQFDPEPPFRPRRNVLKLWTFAAAIFALFAIGTVVGVSYWGLPDWVPISRPTFGLGESDLVLDFPQNKQDRRQLPNGTEYFAANGTVTNVGRKTRAVPGILIVLRDEHERIVYSGEVAPPQRTLAPGESITINHVETDVPKAAKFADIGWKPG